MKNFKKSAKFLSILISLCMLLSFMPTVALAEGEENASAFKITVNADGTTCTVNGFTDEAKAKITADGYELTIPETIDGYTVTAIGDNAFRKSSGYMTYMPGVITMPDTIKSIGKSAFAYCQKMTIEKWPDSLEVIKEGAFNNAQKCTNVTGDFTNTKLRVIEKLAFTGAPGVLRINGVGAAKFPDTLTTVGDNAFTWLTMPTFVFPDSVTSIGKKALSTGYAGLREVHFPRNSVYTKLNADVLYSAYPERTDRLSPSGSCLRLYIPETITTIEDSLLRDVGDNTTAVIYGKYGSAAWDFYNMVKAGLEAGTYTNDAVYPHIEYKSDGTTVSWQNPEDEDKDGKGEMASISFIEYDFDTNTAIDRNDTDMLHGENEMTFTDGTDNTNPATVTSGVAGKFGKAADDYIYKLEANYGHAGHNYKGITPQTLDSAAMEMSFAFTQDFMTSSISARAYTSTAKSTDESVIGEIIKFKNGSIETGGSGIVAKDAQYKKLADVTLGQWITIAVVIPGYNEFGKGSDYIYVYINGVKHEVPAVSPVYGTRHLKFSPVLSLGDTKTLYIDNYRAYTSATEAYRADKDKPASVDFGNVDIFGKVISTDSVTTVADFKSRISTDGAVRVFEDNTYAKQLSDEDMMQAGAMVVIATDNRHTKERVYSYYSVGEFTYEEPNLYEGTNKISFVEGTDNTVPGSITIADEVFGKAVGDKVYRFDASYGHAGHNYISVSSKTYQTITYEASFAFGDKPLGIVITPSLWTVYDEERYAADDSTARIAGTMLKIIDNEVRIGEASFIQKASQNKKLAEYKPGQWINVAVVIPGYKTTGTSTDTLYAYINGEKFDIPLTQSVYGIRHLRVSPNTTYSETKTAYIDNHRFYYGNAESYSAAKDMAPVVDMSGVDVIDDNINIAEGTTVADLKASFNTKAEVRVYKSDSYAELLEDDDELSPGNIVVFATKNNRTTERAYSYYTINRPVSVISEIKLTTAESRVIEGSKRDIENLGEDYYLEAEIVNKSKADSVKLKAYAASYDADGLMVSFDSKDVTVAPGTTDIDTKENCVVFEDIITPTGGTVKAMLWTVDNNEPLCDSFEALFTGKEVYHIVAVGNSWANDAFSYISQIAKADGIDIYAVNMYRGGTALSEHRNYMLSGAKVYNGIEYTPGGTKYTYDISFDDVLYTKGYSWDYMTLQPRATTGYDFDYYYTEENPYITDLQTHMKAAFPKAELMFHQTWALDTTNAKKSTNLVDIDNNITVKDYVADMADDEIYTSLFSLIRENTLRAAEVLGNPGRVVPAGEAIHYAITELGFEEFVLNGEGSYVTGGEGGIYRDTTPHLANKGKLIVAFTWYEYITGNPATECAYTNSSFTDEDMAKMKQAAHWACSQAMYNPAK